MAQKTSKPLIEDEYHKIYDENLCLKKLITEQDLKLKRLGTQLIKIVNRKNDTNDNGKFLLLNANIDEMSMKIKELEQENYSLKDKNTVLRQQLANHSKQIQSVHRSPLRLFHSSPRLNRQQISTYGTVEQYVVGNGDLVNEIPVRDVEESNTHEDIDKLNKKISSLEEELSKNILKAQKKLVDENIEYCSLMRKYKHLEISIKSNKEKENKLEDEINCLKKENESLRNELTLRENDISNLQTKVVNLKSVALEFRELEEQIQDLKSERDNLTGRCSLLMKTINDKTNEFDNLLGLKAIVEENYANLNDKSLKRVVTKNGTTQTESLNNALPVNPVGIQKATQTENDIVENLPKKQETQTSVNELRLQNEVDFLRNLLKTQTQRCDILQNEIANFQKQSELIESKLKDVSQQRDLFYKILEKANLNFDKNELISNKRLNSRSTSSSESAPSSATFTKNYGTYTKTSPNKSPKRPPFDVNVIIKDDCNETHESDVLTPKDEQNINNIEKDEKNMSFKMTSKTVLNNVPIAKPRTILTNKSVITNQSNESLKVTILWIQLSELSDIILNPEVNFLYVDFTVLGISNSDFETPNAKPKPNEPNTRIEFDYTSNVSINQIKTAISNEQNLENPAIIFNIVSEPQTEDEEVECTIVGVSRIDLKELNKVSDQKEICLPIENPHNANSITGQLAVTFSGIESVRSVMAT